MASIQDSRSGWVMIGTYRRRLQPKDVIFHPRRQDVMRRLKQ